MTKVVVKKAFGDDWQHTASILYNKILDENSWDSKVTLIAQYLEAAYQQGAANRHKPNKE